MGNCHKEKVGLVDSCPLGSYPLTVYNCPRPGVNVSGVSNSGDRCISDGLIYFDRKSNLPFPQIVDSGSAPE